MWWIFDLLRGFHVVLRTKDSHRQRVYTERLETQRVMSARLALSLLLRDSVREILFRSERHCRVLYRVGLHGSRQSRRGFRWKCFAKRSSMLRKSRALNNAIFKCQTTFFARGPWCSNVHGSPVRIPRFSLPSTFPRIVRRDNRVLKLISTTPWFEPMVLRQWELVSLEKVVATKYSMYMVL